MRIQLLGRCRRLDNFVRRSFFFGVLLAALLPGKLVRGDDWPQWLGPRRDSVWRETGIIEKFPEGGPKVLWRAKVAGGYAGPAVAQGRVYVSDFATGGDVRAASNPASRAALEGEERTHCFDATSGALLWTHRVPATYAISYPAGPRCTPTVQEGKVYTLGAEGNLFCLDAKSGKVIWSKNFVRDFKAKTPLWGFCGHPLVEGQKLFCIVGGEQGVAYAFDKDTGKELWHALSAREPGYSAPTLIDAGGVRQLLIFHAESINSLNPETGQVYWTVPLEPSYGMAIMPPRQAGDLLFAGGIGGKSVLLKLAADKPAVTELWRGSMKTGASPVNVTPFLEGGMMYAVDQPGNLLGVDLANGRHVWETSLPITGDANSRKVSSGTAFIVKQGKRFFLASETGHLIIAQFSPQGYNELSRWKMLEPTGVAFGRDVVWSHPAFANKCCYARNDRELICVSLAEDGTAAKPPATGVPVPVGANPGHRLLPTYADISYGPHARNTLDFWLAQGKTSRPRPLLVYIHGGGWVVGDKKVDPTRFRAYLDRGISCAAINYRLTPDFPLPAPVHDAARAIQFLRSKANEWNIDTKHIALTGGSAGACTSMWLLLHNDLADPQAVDPVLRESTRVCAAAVTAGQTSIDPRVIVEWLGPNVLKHRMINMAVGEKTIEEALKNYDRHHALYVEFSPYNHVDRGDPPLFMSYTPDMTLPSKDSGHGIHHPVYGVKLKEKSDKVGHECHLLIPGTSKSLQYATADDFLLAKLLAR